MPVSMEYTTEQLRDNGIIRAHFAGQCVERLTLEGHRQLELGHVTEVARLLVEATGCHAFSETAVRKIFDGKAVHAQEGEVDALLERLLKLCPERSPAVAPAVAGPSKHAAHRKVMPMAVSMGSALGRVEDDPIFIMLKSARTSIGDSLEFTQEPDILDKVMPFNTWQVVKRHIKERWPDKSLKTIPDTSIRLLHRGIELGNNDMVDDYPMDGGSQNDPVEIHYLIINDRGGECTGNIGLYVDPQVQVCTSRDLRERVLHSQTSLLRGIVPQLTMEGTGATYMLRDADNKRILAVFKPKDEEACAPQNPRGYTGPENSTGFRQGVFSTQQAAREVAAYLMDHEKYAGVPETTLVHAKHPKFVPVKNRTVWKIGAFQTFIEVKDSAGNFSSQIFAVPDIHRVGILDIRILNLDRNDGNLLVRHSRGSSKYELVPIDHGLSLPDRLEVYTDDVCWMSWPQSRKPFDQIELTYIKNLNGVRDAKLLDKYLGIRRECLRLMEMATLLLQIGAELGLTLYEIGCILYRVDMGSDAPVKQSPFEKILEKCLDLSLVGFGDGSFANSVTLSGLDLHISRPSEGGRLSGLKVPNQSGSDVSMSPFASPAFPASLPTGDAPTPLVLDGLSSSDTPHSPEMPGGPAAKSLNKTSNWQEGAGEATQKSYRPSTSSKMRQRPSQRSSLRGGQRFVESEANEAKGGLFVRPEVRVNDWTPELEKIFKDKVANEVRSYIKKNFARSRQEVAGTEEEASADLNALGTAKESEEQAAAVAAKEEDEEDDDTNFSLASAFSMMPSAVADAAPSRSRKAYVPPMMRNKSSEEKGPDAAAEPEGSTSTASSAAAEANADPPPVKQRWVPPSVRKRMEEEEAALRASGAALSPVPEEASPSAAAAFEPPERPAAAVEDLSAAAAPDPPKRKYVPPQERRRLAEEAAAAAGAQGTAGQSGEVAATPSLSSTARPPGLPTHASAGTDRYGWSVDQGPRKGMEDAIECLPQLGDKPGTEYYAVYDGHSGTPAVEFVLRRMPTMITSHEGFDDPSRIGEVLHDAVVRTDEELIEILRKETPPPKKAPDEPCEGEHINRHSVNYTLSSGSVATVAAVRGNKIHIANLGDCRAVLCRDGEIIQLTVDHHPINNEEDAARLKSLGVSVSRDGTDAYLHGRLGVPRAFGDWAWHMKEKCLGLSSTPDIYEAEVTDDTEFMLLACDGIFEKMSSKEAGQIVRRNLRRTRNAKEAAEALVKNASKMEGTDNLSAIVVIFTLPASNDSGRVAPRMNLFKKAAAPVAEAEATNA